MKRIIGIKFSHYGQIYFFYCEDPFVDRGDRVLAETGQGLGIATVMNIVDRLPEDLPPDGVRDVLRKFVPVTIKMAKEQNLFLNPSKISGICGRLLCCLSYEQENYDIFHSSCPRLGKRYQTNKGPMKVLRANMFRNSVALLTDTNEELELTLDEWQALDPRRPDAPPRPEGKPDAKPENKPSSPRPHDELMVVMADPDTIDEAFGDESDELVDDLGGLNDGEMETLEEGLRPKRKRKRKR